MRAHLDRIAALDGKLRAFITVMADSALEAARAAEAAVIRREPIGSLHGVPVGLKDLYCTKGVRTTGGSRILGDWVPGEDATVVTRLAAAGGIVLGKLNMHEFAYGPEGLNVHYGTSWNPWDPAVHRFCGGSSSGSGAAVAAALCPGALGSDTGGSIRIPSSLCGLTGIKPTYGRVSRAGALPLAWSLDHVGPMCRSAADCALMLRAMAGYDPRDPSTSALPVPDYAAALTGQVRGLRVGPAAPLVPGIGRRPAAAGGGAGGPDARGRGRVGPRGRARADEVRGGGRRGGDLGRGLRLPRALAQDARRGLRRRRARAPAARRVRLGRGLPPRPAGPRPHPRGDGPGAGGRGRADRADPARRGAAGRGAATWTSTGGPTRCARA